MPERCLKLGEKSLAAADLKTALEIDPNHALANLTALRAASGRERLRFATAIIQNDTPSPALDEALQAIVALGCTATGVFRATPDGVLGWLAWSGDPYLQLQIFCDLDARSMQISDNPTHWAAKAIGHAADISIKWPATWSYLKIGVAGHSSLLVNATLLRPQSLPSPRERGLTDSRRASTGTTEKTSVAVIIPIYGDYDATRRCLTSLMADRQGLSNARIILVNDASPDKRIQTLVKELSANPKVSVLTHRTNLGFARTINDALATLVHEDAILLNADTVVPAAFISRLRKAAYSAPDIGTVTPLSNNGEYTSFPIPFRENPLPKTEGISALDRLAATENAGQVIDMPNGTAFCMYVTRSCLDAIGPLSTSFGKGYYEDVEFCLRAASAGFRNVCAADVYVGHAGSRSFGKSKRALVTRNLTALETAFPHYRAISATFVDTDPLAPARRAIEHAMLHTNNLPHRLVIGRRANVFLLPIHATPRRNPASVFWSVKYAARPAGSF